MPKTKEIENKGTQKDSRTYKFPWWKATSFYTYAGSIAILFLLCLFGTWISYSCKKAFPLPNPIYLLIGAVFMIGMWFLVKKFTTTKFFIRYEHLILAVISVLVLLYILIAARYYYFVTGWDAGNVIVNVKRILEGYQVDKYYYSQCSNNLFITILFSWISKTYKEITGKTFTYYSLVAAQCFAMVLSGYFTYYSAKNLTKKRDIALMSWFLFLILGILSPWVVVPYTDVLGVVFLATTLFLYTSKHNPATLILLGLFFALGYYIKPTVLIPAIAIAVCSLQKIPAVIKKKTIKPWLSASFVLVGLAIGILTVKLCISTLHVPLNKDGAFDMTHYFMMGLNEESNGVWNPEDVLFSEGIDTLSERHTLNLQRAGGRLTDMGPIRTIVHIGKKLLVSFNDGSFAWAEEGDFFYLLLDSGNERIESVYRNLYYTDGSMYPLFLSTRQSVWIAVLAFLAIGAFKKKKEESEDFSFLKLSVFGFMLFEILFEPRARHILPCLPILLIMSAHGLYYFTEYSLAARIARKTNARSETLHDA